MRRRKPEEWLEGRLRRSCEKRGEEPFLSSANWGWASSRAGWEAQPEEDLALVEVEVEKMPGIDVRMMSYGERVPAQVSRPECILLEIMKMVVKRRWLEIWSKWWWQPWLQNDDDNADDDKGVESKEPWASCGKFKMRSRCLRNSFTSRPSCWWWWWLVMWTGMILAGRVLATSTEYSSTRQVLGWYSSRAFSHH